VNADRLKAIALVLTAVGGLLTTAATAFRAEQKQTADFEVVKIMAEQLAQARENCR
jgi:hypothetical protein